MGNTLQEIEDGLGKAAGILSTFGGLLGGFFPQYAGYFAILQKLIPVVSGGVAAVASATGKPVSVAADIVADHNTGGKPNAAALEPGAHVTQPLGQNLL